jgi:hypothetical protein
MSRRDHQRLDPAFASCRNQNGVCHDQQQEHFDDYFDDYRAEQEDHYLEHGMNVGVA